MRKGLYRLGVLIFPEAPEDDSFQMDGLVDLENAALEKYLALLKKSRLVRSANYLSDSNTFDELAVYIVVLDLWDKHMLHPFMADPIQPESTKTADSRPKIDKLLEPDDSLLGHCAEGFLELLESWMSGGPKRKWGIVDIVADKAVTDVAYASFARDTVLRVSTQHFRKYDLRCSNTPFSL